MKDRWRLLVIGVVAAVALAIIVSGVVLLLEDDAFGFVRRDRSPALIYTLLVVFIAGDAVVPILPGETTLNTASVLASQGHLNLLLVILAGAAGAILGDNALYWIVRGGSGRVRPWYERLQEDRRVQWALRLLGRRPGMLIVLGRYIPGVRFVVNFSYGMLPLPYREFLPWTIIGGLIWSAYTSLLAYLVGTALQEFPITSIIASGLITTAIIALVYWFEVRRGARDPFPAQDDESATGATAP